MNDLWPKINSRRLNILWPNTEDMNFEIAIDVDKVTDRCNKDTEQGKERMDICCTAGSTTNIIYTSAVQDNKGINKFIIN